MFGLAYLIFFALYLLASLAVVIFAMVWAGRRKRSRLLWGGVAALLMYNLVFWDWLPTVYAHKNYCAKEAGFWVYKTLDQWKVENPGVTEGLVEDKNAPFTRVGDDENHTGTISINQYFYRQFEKQRPVASLSIYRWKDEILEKKNKLVIARRIGFSAGEGQDSLKFWINISECPNGNETLIASRKFAQSIVIGNHGETK